MARQVSSAKTSRGREGSRFHPPRLFIHVRVHVSHSYDAGIAVLDAGVGSRRG